MSESNLPGDANAGESGASERRPGFRAAGASAVIASLADIPDREAAEFFDAVISQIAAGTSPAKAVARVRAEKMKGDPTSWMQHVVVFQ